MYLIETQQIGNWTDDKARRTALVSILRYILLSALPQAEAFVKTGLI